MAPVQDQEGSAGEDLEAGGPGHQRQAAADRLLRDVEAAAAQGFDHRQGRGGIVQLILPGQGQAEGFLLRGGPGGRPCRSLAAHIILLRLFGQEAEFLALQAPRQELHARKTGDMQGTPLFPAGPAHDLHNLRLILIADDIGTGLDDPALVPGDLRQG